MTLCANFFAAPAIFLYCAGGCESHLLSQPQFDFGLLQMSTRADQLTFLYSMSAKQISETEIVSGRAFFLKCHFSKSDMILPVPNGACFSRSKSYIDYQAKFSRIFYTELV